MMTSMQWYIFSAAPHRVMFFGGALQTLAVMLWWLTELVTRYGVFGHSIAWAIAPVTDESVPGKYYGYANR